MRRFVIVSIDPFLLSPSLFFGEQVTVYWSFTVYPVLIVLYICLEVFTADTDTVRRLGPQLGSGPIVVVGSRRTKSSMNVCHVLS